MSSRADLERADPGPAVQNADDGHGTTQKNAKSATTTTGDSDLVAAWMQRLQTLTVITTFLASIDGELFTLTSASSQVTVNASLKSQEFVYACFTGALVFHVCASILGYLASFALIRYEVIDATPSSTKSKELGEPSNSGLQHQKQLQLRPIVPFEAVKKLLQTPLGLQFQSRTSTPPINLLTRCYFTTLALSGVGFILALLGIATYAWFGLQHVVGIFTTACIGVSFVACVWAMVYP
ncbi:uncharacterized protein EDB91DRAFT_1131828 [Suillus paluster]|uniref:uncharacterized protein n=1 Tax=Suillus paluster TaxID=48578 RepID=UPI001B85E241|nr:uncharacterized protein EDB91DRAFT_1131828 [Suillus paluster]KAG1740856.1 hypothetical protein EDB91DRAFT_1131828 [Suillus paluster]